MIENGEGWTPWEKSSKTKDAEDAEHEGGGGEGEARRISAELNYAGPASSICTYCTPYGLGDFSEQLRH